MENSVEFIANRQMSFVGTYLFSRKPLFCKIESGYAASMFDYYSRNSALESTSVPGYIQFAVIGIYSPDILQKEKIFL